MVGKCAGTTDERKINYEALDFKFLLADSLYS